jgi:hypothetical protein
MSALPPKADMQRSVSAGPLCAISGYEQMQPNEVAKARLLYRLGGGGLQRQWYSEAERLGSPEIDDQFEFGWLFYGQISRFRQF